LRRDKLCLRGEEKSNMTAKPFEARNSEQRSRKGGLTVELTKQKRGGEDS
jgi:hypothetical protein